MHRKFFFMAIDDGKRWTVDLLTSRWVVNEPKFYVEKKLGKAWAHLIDSKNNNTKGVNLWFRLFHILSITQRHCSDILVGSEQVYIVDIFNRLNSIDFWEKFWELFRSITLNSIAYKNRIQLGTVCWNPITYSDFHFYPSIRSYWFQSNLCC